MAWYYILFLFVLSFFLIKMILTLTIGDSDIDVDFDADGDVDFDLSSMFSFKGALHFLLGFSSYLAAIAHFNSTTAALNEIYQFTIADYIIAIVIGIIFTYILFQLYKLMMKFNHYNNQNIDVNNYTCTILISNGLTDVPGEAGKSHAHMYSYTVLVNTEIGSRKINVLSPKSNLEIGSEHKIYKNVQGIYYI